MQLDCCASGERMYDSSSGEETGECESSFEDAGGSERGAADLADSCEAVVVEVNYLSGPGGRFRGFRGV